MIGTDEDKSQVMPEVLPTDGIRVLLVEDHQLFRERLGMLVNKEMGMKVCAEADSSLAALALIQETQPHIVIADITLSASSGLDLIALMRSRGFKTPVLVLSMHDESVFADRALEAGARGYIMKSEASQQVIKAIRQVLGGGIYLSDEMKRQTRQRLARQQVIRNASVETLTSRELQVFALLAAGHAPAAIAASLGLGKATVDTHVSRIREKLGLRNLQEVMECASHWERHQAEPRPSSV